MEALRFFEDGDRLVAFEAAALAWLQHDDGSATVFEDVRVEQIVEIPVRPTCVRYVGQSCLSAAGSILCWKLNDHQREVHRGLGLLWSSID